MQRALVSAISLVGLAACSAPPMVVGNQPLSQSDIRAIKQVVLQRPDIRKPILNIFFDRPDHAWVITGEDDHVGAINDRFRLAKRQGRWHIDSKIEEQRILVMGR